MRAGNDLDFAEFPFSAAKAEACIIHEGDVFPFTDFTGHNSDPLMEP